MRDGLQQGAVDFVLRAEIRKTAPLRELRKFRPDVILADSSVAFLTLARREFSALPLILISGKRRSRLDEAIDGSAIRIPRSRLPDLGPIIRKLVNHRPPRPARRQAARTVRASWYEEIFKNLSDPVFAFESGGDGCPGTILEVNGAACRLLGYEREELLKMSFSDIVDARTYSTLPVLPIAKPDQEPSRFAVLLRRKSRKEASVEMRAQLLSVGGRRIVFAIVRDTFARAVDVEILQRLAAIVESSDDAIIAKTLQGVITSWNTGASRLYGYEAEEVIGRHISMLQPPDQREDMGAVLDLVRRGKHIKHYETVRVTKDGQRINISLTISPIKDVSGTIIGASATERDITERALRDAERERLLAELQEALARVKALHGLLPICAWCKKVRNDKGYWQEVEMYIHEHADVDFSHGICPDCAAKLKKEHFPDSD